MTGIAVCATAYTKNHERYDSVHTPPSVEKYIESVTPGPLNYADGGKFVEVDTATLAQVVVASPQVKIGNEIRKFSYWVLMPDPLKRPIHLYGRTLELNQGEFGWVGVVFGVERAAIMWPRPYPMPKRGAVEEWPDLYRHIRDHLGPGPDPGPYGPEIVLPEVRPR